MTWDKLHAESEQLATEAQLALHALNTERALALYKQAAQAEQKALERLDLSKVRTRGITAVSAVALWLKANEYEIAEQLAYSMLADRNIPEFAHEELKKLVQSFE